MEHSCKNGRDQKVIKINALSIFFFIHTVNSATVMLFSVMNKSNMFRTKTSQIKYVM